MSGQSKAFKRVEITSRAQWRAWLDTNHDCGESVWLVTYKKKVGALHVPYSDLVEEALCFGWIDSLPRKLDDDRTMLLLSPRKPGSAWSVANKERAERMIAVGLMTPAGLAKIEQAKADGKWEFLDDVAALAIPADLEAAFIRYPGSRGHFAAFPPSVRRGILEWIKQAKRAETRAKRVEETAEQASYNLRANQWRNK